MKQQNLFKAETTWFHVFKAMIDNGDVAKMGPYAVTVYLVIKSFTNWSTGRAFPSIDTISEKSGISVKQVKRCLKILEECGYISKRKEGRKNVYTLREKIQMVDQEGRPAAVATWDYLPSTVEAARAELQNFLLTGEGKGQFIHIEHLTLNMQINNGEGGNTQYNLGDIPKGPLRDQMVRFMEKMGRKK